MTKQMDDQPQHRNWDDDEGEHDEDDAEEKEPVAPVLAAVGIEGMPLQEIDVFAVGFPGDIESVAEDGDGADESIDGDVDDHAGDGDSRELALPGGEDDEERSRSGEQVAEAGDKADEGIEAEADGGAGNLKDVVEPGSEPVQGDVVEAARFGMCSGSDAIRRDDLGLGIRRHEDVRCIEPPHPIAKRTMRVGQSGLEA